MANSKSSVQLFVYLFVLSLFMFLVQVNAKCEMTTEDLDKCALQSNLFGNPKWKVPQTEDELTAICGDAKKAFQCIGTYVKTCMNTFAQTIFGAVQNYAKKDYKDRCVDPDGRKLFLKHIACSTDAGAHDKVYANVHGYVGQLNYLINLHASMSKEDRIQTSCCSLSLLHESMLANIKTACPSSLDYWKSKIVVTEHMENTCGPYQTVAYCDANANAQYWSKLKKIFDSPENEGVEMKYKSPVTALIVYMQQTDA